MRKSRFTEEQMVVVLREADRTSVAETAKKHKVSEQTIYAWRKHFGELAPVGSRREGSGVSDIAIIAEVASPHRLDEGSSSTPARSLARLTGIFVLATLLGACTTTAPLGGWDHRLRGDALVLLGEVHDNAQQHQLRLATLQRAFASGWRPAIAMEQFDREHQADIDRARLERPGDAQHLIDVAGPSGTRAGGGWNWAFYRPFVELALRYDVPLIAANLSNADAERIVRGGYSAVFSEATIAALGLSVPVTAEVQSAQEREIDTGHCHVLPPLMWPRMARAQFARDAAMAEVLRLAAQGGGVVLLAGNGHVRHDIGVPRWLGTVKNRVFAIGYLEITDDSTPVTVFDAVVRTAVAERADPCAEFERRAADK